MALQYAKNVYNLKVIAVDINETQLEFAREMGADMTVNPLNEDLGKVVQEKVGGAHAAVGKSAFNNAVDVVRAGGKVVAVDLPVESKDLSIPRLVLDRIEVIGSLVGTRQDLKEALQFAVEGKVVPKCEMRTMEDINDIFEEMEAGKIKGCMVIDLKK